MEMFAMSFLPGDEEFSTAHLSLEQFGAYCRLKNHYWLRRSLPTDDDALARILRCPIDDWQKVRPVIAPFFDSEWRNPVWDNDFASAKARHEKNVKKGKLGAEIKKQKIGNPIKNDFSDFTESKPDLSRTESTTASRAYEKLKAGLKPSESIYSHKAQVAQDKEQASRETEKIQ